MSASMSSVVEQEAAIFVRAIKDQRFLSLDEERVADDAQLVVCNLKFIIRLALRKVRGPSSSPVLQRSHSRGSNGLHACRGKIRS